jgi:hypothetical protein
MEKMSARLTPVTEGLAKYAKTNELLALRARVAKLEAALTPFAEIETPHDAPAGTWVAKTLYCNNQITAFQVCAARAALKDTPQ